ncbi:unnamed protein product [Boreogadus saida]
MVEHSTTKRSLTVVNSSFVSKGLKVGDGVGNPQREELHFLLWSVDQPSGVLLNHEEPDLPARTPIPLEKLLVTARDERVGYDKRHI